MRIVVAVLLVVATYSPAGVMAQAVPPPTSQPPVGTGQLPPQSRAARDSVLQDSLRAVREGRITWPTPDSVAAALFARPGRALTRFFGHDTLWVDGSTGRITLVGKPAAVQRDSAVIAGDTIIFDDSLGFLQVRGDHIVLRDPERNPGGDAVEARGVMTYDLRSRRFVVHEVRTATVEEGERYILRARRAAFVVDSTERYATYGHYGSLTTCTDPNPHYHIKIGSFKMVAGRFIVGAPATLFIADVPVMILPLFINDLRSGRRSGLLTPRFGFSAIVRTSSSYRRTIENVGLYWAMSDYMDATMWLDWRSGANAPVADPGWIRYAAQLNYKWLDRFLSGQMGVSHSTHGDGRTNTAINLQHRQEFSGRSSLSADINFMTSTTVHRRQEIIPTLENATIRSRLNYSRVLGPFSISAGGARTQYPGQEQEDQNFPTLSISSKPISLLGALTLTPNLSFNNSQRFKSERGGQFAWRYFVRSDGVTDSARVTGDSRNTTMSFDAPLSLGRLRWTNNFQVTDVEDNFPQLFVVRDVRDTSIVETRIYQRTFRTDLDWRTNLSIPATFMARTLNITPSFGISNVHPAAFLIRSERSGGEFVAQAKRPSFGIGMSPTLHGFMSGFGPFSRIRHSIAFQLGYSYSPAADVPDEFLEAIGATRQGYLGSLPQSQVTLGMNHVFEARLKRDSTAGATATKVRLLSLNLSALTYDFERAKATGRTGLSTEQFAINARSDLLPGLDFGANYSLFEGSTLSDSAKFKPFLTGIRASFSISRNNNPIKTLLAMFGGNPGALQAAPQPAQPGAVPGGTAGQLEPTSVVGPAARQRALSVGAPSEFSARIEYSLSKQRPPTGDVLVIENVAAARCQTFIDNPIVYDACLREAESLAHADPNGDFRPPGGAFIRQPTRSSVSLSMNTPITKLWSASWSTSYDFEVGDFASHIVNLNRDMHDWNASFSFTQSARGAFMFSFLISLKAQPDIKIDYTDQNYGRR